MDPRIKRVMNAVLSPVSLAVGAAGGATFALSGMWWVLPLTGVAWGVLSATQIKGSGSGGADLPAPYATRLHVLRTLIGRIEKAVSTGSATLQACLGDIPVTLVESSAKVEDLLRRQARIDAYLAEVHPQVAAAELGRLEASLNAAESPATRAKWASAVENKRAEIAARAHLKDTSERLAAELAEIESALETTLSKIVSLEHAEGEATAELQAGIAGGLSDVLVKVSALEQALAETNPRASRVG